MPRTSQRFAIFFSVMSLVAIGAATASKAQISTSPSTLNFRDKLALGDFQAAIPMICDQQRQCCRYRRSLLRLG